MADATSATNTTLYHNPQCSKSRGALEWLTQLAAEKSLVLDVVEYLKSPLKRETLQELLSQLPNNPTDLVRRDKKFKALELDEADYQDANQVVELLLAHPELMQRPVAVFCGKAAIGRPPEDLKELYS